MNIKANGTHALKTQGHASVLYVAGDLGGGTATLGITFNGSFVSLKDDTDQPVTLVSGQQYTVYHGFNADLKIELTGATAPNLNVTPKVLN